MVDDDAVVLSESFQQLHPLPEHPLPAVPVGIFHFRVAVSTPFLEQSRGAVFSGEEGQQGLFEGPTKQERGSLVLLAPTVQIAVAVGSRAAQVLSDLGVAIGHGAASLR